MKLTKKSCISLMIGILATVSGFQSAEAASLSELSLAHYKRANIHVKRGEHKQAIEHYKAAYRLNPDGKTGEYSVIALKHYGLSVEQNDMSKTTEDILRQAKDYMSNSDKVTKNSVTSRDRFTKAKLRSIEQDEDQAVRDVVNNPSYTTALVPNHFHGFGRRRGFTTFSQVRTVDPVATQARIDLVKAEARREKQKVLDNAAEREANLKNAHDERVKMINESAVNLYSQMKGKGVKLNPSGSNLYVRSYK